MTQTHRPDLDDSIVAAASIIALIDTVQAQLAAIRAWAEELIETTSEAGD